MNVQMLLTYIRATQPTEYSRAFGEAIPSVRKLQELIEEGWKKGPYITYKSDKLGIDRMGAAQLRSKLGSSRYTHC